VIVNRTVRQPATIVTTRPAGCGPCAAEQRGSPGPPACASADETRASCGDVGCWAETCACSRESSRSWWYTMLTQFVTMTQFYIIRRCRAGTAAVARPIRAKPCKPAHTIHTLTALTLGQPTFADSARRINGTLTPATGQTTAPVSYPTISLNVGGRATILLWTTGCAGPLPVVSVQPTTG
jgi:hypothetical protein